MRLIENKIVAPGSIEAASQQIKPLRIFEDLRESCLSLISSRNIYKLLSYPLTQLSWQIESKRNIGAPEHDGNAELFHCNGAKKSGKAYWDIQATVLPFWRS